jgi:hypothetical protein
VVNLATEDVEAWLRSAGVLYPSRLTTSVASMAHHGISPNLTIILVRHCEVSAACVMHLARGDDHEGLRLLSAVSDDAATREVAQAAP